MLHRCRQAGSKARADRVQVLLDQLALGTLSWEGVTRVKTKVAITDEFIQKALAAGKQYSLFLYKAGPNRNQAAVEAERLQREHLRFLFGLRVEGKLLLNGPVTDGSDLKGIGIFKTTDAEEARGLLDGDPAVQAGRLTYEIHPWFGLPGDSLPE